MVKVSQRRSVRVAIISLILGFQGCSTTQVEPLPEFPAEPPPYVQVPHPVGLDLGDVRALFAQLGAPDRKSQEACDSDYQKLRAKTVSKDELALGARGLVRNDPVKYHWCFYSMVLKLEERLTSDAFIDERQKAVVDHYLFLTPIARGFMSEFNDSRYLRWAVNRYRKISEFVFYRKVEASPELTSELIRVANPFPEQRAPLDTEATVLEKYGIIEPTAMPVALPDDEPGVQRSPAADSTDVKTDLNQDEAKKLAAPL